MDGHGIPITSTESELSHQLCTALPSHIHDVIPFNVLHLYFCLLATMSDRLEQKAIIQILRCTCMLHGRCVQHFGAKSANYDILTESDHG